MEAEDFIRGVLDDQAALGIEPIEIDVQQIEDESKDYIDTLVHQFAAFYYDEQFLSQHPKFHNRIKVDIESLISLRKMKRMDEITQDSLVKAIAGNPNNASLYRALTDIQRTILNIQTKIDEIVRSMTSFMKGYQMEIDFNPTSEEPVSNSSDDSPSEVMTRGSKEFIQQMRSEN